MGLDIFVKKYINRYANFIITSKNCDCECNHNILVESSKILSENNKKCIIWFIKRLFSSPSNVKLLQSYYRAWFPYRIDYRAFEEDIYFALLTHHILILPQDCTVLIVTHNLVIASILCTIAKKELKFFADFTTASGAISRVNFLNDIFTLEEFNFIDHLKEVNKTAKSAGEY